MTSKHFRTPMRPLIYSVAAALSLLGTQAHAKFADAPLHLQNETRTGGQLKVKHNIMLFIDDSGSMKWVPKERREPEGREKSRLTITKEALNGILDTYQSQFNWSLQTLHNNGGTDTPDFQTPWTSMKDKVNGIQPNNGTPTTRRYYEIIRNIVMPKVEYRCQKSFVVLMSDGDANFSQRCGDYARTQTRPFFNPSRAGRRYGDGYDGYDGYNDDYFGRLNAGRCYSISGGSYDDFWDRKTGLAFFSKRLSDTDFKTAGVDKAGKSWNGAPNDPADFSKQTVQTFTVGFGEGLSSSGREYLQNGASQPGYFFNASSQEELNASFKAITDTISNQSQNQAIEATGTVAPAVTSSGISGLAATVQLDTGKWSSRLQFFGINKADGSVNTNISRYPSFANRKTLINTDGKKTFFADKWVADGKNKADGYFGFTKAGEAKDALIPWVTRSGNDLTISEQRTAAKGYSQNYRVRSPASPADKEVRNMGDILDSPVLTVGGGTSDGLRGGRNEYLVTSANDGMVHLFKSADAADAEHPYDLKLSYIPAAMERNMGATAGAGGNTLAHVLKNPAHAEYGKPNHPHRYMVNGGIVVRRTPDDGKKGQQSFMFGAMGQGGRGAYALNIGGKNRGTGNAVGLDAPQSSWNTSVPLFETAKNTEKDQTLNTLGFTVGTPQIGRIALKRDSKNVIDTAKDVRYAGFLTSGYGMEKGKANETALYIYDMLGQNAESGAKEGSSAGTLIRKIEITGNTSGLSSPTLVDADFDGIVDAAYAGDYAGNMYRFDLRATDPNKWTASKIFTGSATRPITAAPAISRRSANKYVVIFGTGSDVYQEDVNDKNQQAVYGIYDDLGATVSTPATEANLQGQTLEIERGADTNYRKITATKAVGAEKKGWMVQLGETDGERVVVKPTMILRTAVISTRIYDQKVEDKTEANDPCTIDSHKTETKSSSWVLALNAETGGALSKRDAHLKFIQANMPNQAYYAGQQRSGITSFTYMDAGKLNDSPVSKDGDAGGSGTDQALKAANIDVPNNKCFSRNAVRVLLTNEKNSIDIGGRICGIRRLSWREIFF